MVDTLTYNELWKTIDNLDIKFKIDLVDRIIKSLAFPKKSKSVADDKQVIEDEEYLNSCCGILDWDEKDYPTDQFISDIKLRNSANRDNELLKMLLPNE